MPYIDGRAEYWVHAADYAGDQDRKWFRDHPNATYYYRKAIEGEFGLGHYPEDAKVLVEKVSDSVRNRHMPEGVVIFGEDTSALQAITSAPTLTAEQAKSLEEVGLKNPPSAHRVGEIDMTQKP